MKRFDKGYIWSNLVSDLLLSLILFFTFFEEIFFEENTDAESMIAAIPYFAIAFVFIYLCFLAYRIAYYRTSGYELTETEIKCKRGVLFKKHSVLDYQKIHAVNKKQNIFHRFFGIAVLTVDSGSTNTSHMAEIVIIEKDKTVDALLDELNALKENKGQRTAERTKKEEILLSEDDSLYSFTSKRKMLYTFITIVSIAVPTALLGILAIAVLGVCRLMIHDFTGSWGAYSLIVTLVTLSVVLVLSVLSFIACIIRMFVGYYGFTVAKRGNEIRISFGLLEKHTNTFSYDRIKAVKISQGLLQRMFGFAEIRLEVIGYTYETGNNNATELGVLVPFCKYSEIGEILDKILPEYVPDEKQTKAPAFFPFVSWFLLILGIVTAVILAPTVAVMCAFSLSASVIGATVCAVTGIALFVLAFKLLSSALAYQTNGLAIKNGKITAYSGGLIKRITVLKHENLIAVADVTTPLRKKAGIASLVLHLRTNAQSNEVKIHIQEEALSEELENLLIL